ncbi:MAG: hypothetical protein KDB49_14990, partial [Mycobacterium sp.]|nr:hypothetical protein [Mycobacterium sp.]
WAAFDPKTVITRHGPYDNLSAWLGVSDDTPTVHRDASTTPPPDEALAGWDNFSETHVPNA